MAKWAIHDDAGHVTNTFDVDPATVLHPDLAKHYVAVDDSVTTSQDRDSEGKYSERPAAAEAVEGTLHRRINRFDFNQCLTAADRKALRDATATDDTVEDFLDMFTYGPHDLEATDVKADIDYFVTKSFIGADSKAKLDAWGK